MFRRRKMDSNLVTCIITTSVTLTVCLINNYFISKRENKQRDDKHAEQLNQIKADYSSQMDELKTDFYARFQELQSIVSAMMTENKHSLEMIKMEIKILSEKQEKYNHLQERTYKLELESEVQKEKIRSCDEKIKNLMEEK